MHGHILWEPRVENYYLCVLDIQRLLGVKLWDSGKVLGGQAILRLNDNLVTLPVSSGAFTYRQLPFLRALGAEHLESRKLN